MKVWSPDEFVRAWNYASHAHHGQVVPGTEIPYVNHLGNVAMEVMTAIVQSPDVASPDLAVQCALLHDVIEDTDRSYSDVCAEFGVEVGNGVLALSKNPTLPTKVEQMRDSIDRIREQPREVWMVKLADRITNLQPPPKHWDTEKIRRYREEALFILESLGGANQHLANRLQQKIAHYVRYF